MQLPDLHQNQPEHISVLVQETWTAETSLWTLLPLHKPRWDVHVCT